MKTSEIHTGLYFFNGKESVREVLAIEGSPLCVRYRILAARQEQEYSSAEKKMVSVIGRESSCQLESFADWAKAGFSVEDGEALLLELKAKKVKLSPGELAFVKSALDEAGGEVTPGTIFTFDHTEGRAVSGLEKKGLVVRHKGQVEVTALGAAWFRNATQLRTEG